MTLDERLREASRDVHRAAADTPDRPLSRRLDQRPAVTALAGVAIVFAVVLPVFLMQGPGVDGSVSSNPDPIDSTTPLEPTATSAEPDVSVESPDTSPVPDEVLAYWSLEGTLESVGDEPGWICPAMPNVGYTSIVSASDLPASLSLELPNQTPVESYFLNDGPACNQPPGLVLLAFTDQAGLTANAGMTVYPSTTRFEDTCPPENCSVEGSSEEGLVDAPPLDDLTINGQPAELFTYEGNFRLWWVDPNGVPLYAEASGLTREQMLPLAESTTVDPATHLTDIAGELPAGLQIVEQTHSVGIWEPGLSRTDVYDIEGTSIAISTRYNSGQTPYARHTFNVAFSELVDVEGTTALWIPEGGNFLSFRTAGGVNVTIDGALSLETAVQIVRDLR